MVDCSKVLDHKGLVMKSSISQGIVTFIVVFGLRGLTTVRETQDALRCAVRCKHELDLFDEVHTVSISCTTGELASFIIEKNVSVNYDFRQMLLWSFWTSFSKRICNI